MTEQEAPVTIASVLSTAESHIDPNPPPPPEPKYEPFRVFINNVDGYFARHVAAHLSDKLFGALKMGQGADEGAEEAGGEESPRKAPPPLPADRYELIGNQRHKSAKLTEDFSGVLNEEDENFVEKILICGTIIYDITGSPESIPKAMQTLEILVKQLEDLKEVGDKTFAAFDEPKTFILVSPVMTWALTKPLDPDEPELPFSEVDYRKRRPHPNYRTHFAAERDVMKTGRNYGPDKLKTYVICSGIMYGLEEEDLNLFFRMAWYNEVLPLFDNGNNFVPLIHINDLAKVVHGLIENVPRKPQYILAVEQTPSTLKKIITSLSKSMSSGKVDNVVAEEAFLLKNMTQSIYEKCTINVNMEPVFIVENLQIPWQSESPLPENMNQICVEFKTAHKLKPIKMVIHGPPGSGKTQLAQKLCEHYKLHYISIATMIDELLAEWRESLAKAEKKAQDALQLPQQEQENVEEEDELEEVEEEDEDPQAILERIREIEILMENGVDKIPDDILIGLAKGFLAKNKCQNRGYILDDYPKTIEQAKELFGVGSGGGGEGEEEEGGEGGGVGNIIQPELVVSLLASDEFICKNAMSLTEEEVKDTRYSESNFLKRLEDYRDGNTEDNTVLNFIDELEIDIMLNEIDENETIEKVFEEICKRCGAPVGFGLTPEELEELLCLEEEERRLAKEKEEIERQLELERAEQERKDKMEEWAETLTRLQMEEEKILIAESEPLRHYLMKFVFPTLTKGLIELARLKPDDPVDFLAEYLFKQNPEAKMFDPSWNQQSELLDEDYERDIKSFVNEEEEIELM